MIDPRDASDPDPSWHDFELYPEDQEPSPYDGTYSED